MKGVWVFLLVVLAICVVGCETVETPSEYDNTPTESEQIIPGIESITIEKPPEEIIEEESQQLPEPEQYQQETVQPDEAALTSTIQTIIGLTTRSNNRYTINRLHIEVDGEFDGIELYHRNSRDYLEQSITMQCDDAGAIILGRGKFFGANMDDYVCLSPSIDLYQGYNLEVHILSGSDVLDTVAMQIPNIDRSSRNIILYNASLN